MKLSHSSVNTYLECAYKWHLHYNLKLRASQEKSALKIGDAIDSGLNHLLETRQLDEAINIFQNKWEAVAKSGNIQYSKSDVEEHLLEDVEITKESDKGYYSWLKKGEILLREYNDQIMPRIKNVIKVQLDDVLKYEDGSFDEIAIKTDFICEWEDGRRILFDNKTSSMRYDKDSVKESAQLALYFEALKDRFKLDAAGYIVIPKKVNKQKKPLVKIEVIIDKVSEKTIDNTFETFNTVFESIKKAEFNKNHDACHGKFGKCQFYEYCHNNSVEGLKEEKYGKK